MVPPRLTVSAMILYAAETEERKEGSWARLVFSLADASRISEMVEMVLFIIKTLC